MTFQPNDLIIIVYDETPSAFAERRGRKKPKDKYAQRKMKKCFVDTVDKINAGVATTKRKAFRMQPDSKAELPADANARAAQGKPARSVYHFNIGFLKLPRGLQCDIEEVDLDEDTIEYLIKPYDESIRSNRA